jgi:phage-related minor tail protein
MTMTPDDDAAVTVAVRADMGDLEQAFADTDRIARGFGRSLSSALEGATVRGKSLGDVLRGLGTRLSDLALRSALKPLESGFSGMFEGLLSNVMPFAKGGVVGAPTYFPMSGGRLGLMGEAGAEAIMPLARGPDGRLGVRTASGGGGGGGGGVVTINISTPDVDGFRRSEAQVSAALARAVARGRRGL